MCAWTKSFTSKKESILLINIDPNGTVKCARSVEGEYKRVAGDMIGTRDGGFLVVESASTTLEAN